MKSRVPCSVSHVGRSSHIDKVFVKRASEPSRKWRVLASGENGELTEEAGNKKREQEAKEAGIEGKRYDLQRVLNLIPRHEVADHVLQT